MAASRARSGDGSRAKPAAGPGAPGASGSTVADVYDYVIVGAGSAGCVLAARLSEDPLVRVALIEAGPTDRKMDIHIPLAFSNLFKSPYDWAFNTSSQKELDGRSLYWPRGRTLGGSSSLNAMMWVRGHRDDYDTWARTAGEGWSYDEVERYFRRAERWAGAPGGRVHGTAGPLWISPPRDANPLTATFLEACAEAGLPRLPELNEPDHSGCALTPLNQRRGRRWSAADGYLRPARRRANLTVMTGRQVRRVLVEQGRARGVELLRGGTVRARREVVLSAGAIGSPHLLMLSGIGDPEHLGDLEIPVKADLPGVGRNLEDHLSVPVLMRTNRPITLAGADSPTNLARYLLARRGPLTSNVGEAVAFIRSEERLAAPDLELIFAPGMFVSHGMEKPTAHALTIGVVLLQPESRGRITLAGDDPALPPRIDPGYLSSPADARRLLAGVRYAERLYATRAMSPYVTEAMPPWPGKTDDEAVVTAIRALSETLYHPVGTCRMGDDEHAVTDCELRVRGVRGLRVVDASVMPRITRGHTHAPTVMIAERAADLIREDREDRAEPPASP